MVLKLFQVDAFADALFRGNPAAVCPLEGGWLPDDLMQSIAAENNLSETAFFYEENGTVRIRWFTPLTEVAFCGHATLAAAHVLFEELDWKHPLIPFSTRSGLFPVQREGNEIRMDFPADPVESHTDLSLFRDAFGYEPAEAYRGKTDFMLVYDTQQQIETMPFDLSAIRTLPVRGVIITAPGQNADFVSRFFAPQSGIDEDPVTGSAHTTLAPYWSRRLNRTRLRAQQLSSRGGQLMCRLREERVEVTGRAVLYMKGEISLPSPHEQP